MSAIAATSPACIATSMPARAAPRRCRPRSSTSCSPSSSAGASRPSTSPAARPSSMRISAGWSRAARDMGVRVIDRCNLTILEVPGQEDLAAFLAAQQVEIVASMPCYLEDNVDRQRGKGVFDASIRGLQKAQCARLRPRRQRRSCSTSSTIRRGRRCRRRRRRSRPTTSACSASATASCSTGSITLANMPIQRFGAILIAKGEFDRYLDLLQHAHLDANLDHVMCRNLISVDWQGYVYDCDFNQMLDLPLEQRRLRRRARASVRPARRRARRPADPRRRPLLRLHRRPGIELRRRAEGSGGVTRPRSSTGRLAETQRAGAPGGCAPRTIAIRHPCSTAQPEFTADVLYVVGGLYGNLAALDAVERLAAQEGADHRLQRRLPLVRRRAGLVRRDRAAASRAIARSAAMWRPRSRATTTSAPAAAAPIRPRSARTWCAARTRS